MDTFVARAAALQLLQNALLSSANSEAVKIFIRDLPFLSKEHIPLEDNCPICLLPFLEILEESTKKGEREESGVTRLEGCGHVFCRRDLVEWIRTHHLNCPTCRFQFIQTSAYQDDASSDGGEYLPSSDGEEDIGVDPNVSEPADFIEDAYDVFAPDWEDSIGSGSIIDLELEEHEVATEAWIDDYDPGYGDIGVEGGEFGFEPEHMEEGPVDPGFDPMIENAGDLGSETCPEEGPDPRLDEVIGPVVEDDPWDPSEFNAAEELDLLELDPAELEDEMQDGYFDPEMAMDETSEDVEVPDLPSEELEYEPDLDPGSELGALEHDHCVEWFSDSEQEELEVELGLTDGESNTSSFSEDEIQGPVQSVSTQISTGDDSTGETIISHTYGSQFLK